jgi:hypothetical protein
MNFVHLQISSTFVLPDIYKSGKTKEIEEALWIGALIQGKISRECTNDTIAMFEENKQKEILAIRTKADNLENNLKSEIVELQTRIDIVRQKHLEELRDTKKKVAQEKEQEYLEQISVFQQNIAALESRRKFLEQSRDTDIATAVKRERETLERIILEKEKDQERMLGIVDRLQDTIARQTDELSKLGNSISRRTIDSKHSTEKGASYEEIFKSKLCKYYGILQGFELKDTAKSGGHEGDQVMMIENKGVMWELKNYADKVPSIEVKKFLKDLKGMEGVRIGVMVSRKSDITGIGSGGGPFVIDVIDDRLVIYINRFEELFGESQDEYYVFQILLGIFRMWWKYGSINRGANEENSRVDCIEEILHEAEKGLEDLAKRRTEWRTHKGRIDDCVRWIGSLLDDSVVRLSRLIKKIKEKSDDECSTSNELPSSLIVGCTDKYEKIVSSLLKLYVFDADSNNEISVNEICEAVAKDIGQTKESINRVIGGIFIDSVFVKHRNTRYIVGIGAKC